MRSLFSIGLATLCLTINSHADSRSAHRRGVHLSNEEKQRITQHVVDMARKFSSSYFEKLTMRSTRSQIVSPLSVFIVMSVLAYGARRGTREDFLEAIRLEEDETRIVRIGYTKFLHQLANYDVDVKTKIFVSPGARLNPYFYHLCDQVFKSEIEIFNVTNAFMQNEQIYEWVADQTKEHVTTLFQLDQITSDRKMRIVNTVNFKGTWKNAFNRSLTAPRRFYRIHKNPLNVMTMRTIGRFRLGRLDDLNASFIVLPCKENSKGNAMSMVIFLSDETGPDGSSEMIRGLKNLNLTRILNSTMEDVEVFLPRFRINTTVALSQYFSGTFREIHPFDETAQFAGIFNSSSLANFAESETRAVIKVDEEGQETAASGGISYDSAESIQTFRRKRSLAHGVKLFKVDRPFVAMVMATRRLLCDVFTMHVTGSQFHPGQPRHFRW